MRVLFTWIWPPRASALRSSGQRRDTPQQRGQRGSVQRRGREQELRNLRLQLQRLEQRGVALGPVKVVQDLIQLRMQRAQLTAQGGVWRSRYGGHGPTVSTFIGYVNAAIVIFHNGRRWRS